MAQKSSSSSTISRLESKYSDILDRVAKRREKQRQEKEDRDKTLEPDYRSSFGNPLMKSSTTASVKDKLSLNSQKERTPYRLTANKSKYEPESRIKRSELLGISSNNLNGYDSNYNKLKSTDSGYSGYESKLGKENIYKSKYDPDLMMSDSSISKPKTSSISSISSTTPSYAGSSSSASTRQLRSYKRTDSGDKHRTTVNLYNIDDDDGYDLGNRLNRYKGTRSYTQRKSANAALLKPRSETQKFFEMEDLQEEVDPEKLERENKRKEIQSLIMKYAQMDDFYGIDTVEEPKRPAPPKDTNNNNIWDSNGARLQSPVVIPQKSQTSSNLLKSQTMTSIPQYSTHYQSNYDRPNYYNGGGGGNSNVVAITTNNPTTNVAPLSSRTRMSKALSTFVRNLNLNLNLYCK